MAVIVLLELENLELLDFALVILDTFEFEFEFAFMMKYTHQHACVQ
jgi:hypothetical protein